MLPPRQEGAKPSRGMDRRRREPAPAKTRQLSAVALGAPPQPGERAAVRLSGKREKQISKAMSFTGQVGRSGSSAGVCCTVMGHHVSHSSQRLRLMGFLSHQHNFYTGKTYQAICFYIQLVYFHKETKIHTYNPIASSHTKILLLPAQSAPQCRRKALSYLKSSLISRTVAWNGMFRTRILEVVCFLTVCFFRDDFTVGL